jgi:capsular polysaccharide biosynthesis protein/tetratricopeptide (TPR) repeat protein
MMHLSDRPAALFERARRHLLARETTLAESLLGQGRILAPDDPGMASLHGIALMMSDDASAAAEAFHTAVRLAPDDKGAALLLTRALRAAGDRPAMRRARADLLARFRDDADLFNEIASDLMEDGEAPTAADLLQQALSLAPEHADALHNLGVCHARLGLLDTAETRLREALDRRPDHAPTLAALAGVLQQAARPDEAMALAHTLIARSTEELAAYTVLGTALSALNRLGEAVQAFEQAHLLDSDNPTVRINLAEALERCGRVAEALPHWDHAVRHPGLVDSAEVAAKLRLYRNDPAPGEAVRPLFRLADLPGTLPEGTHTAPVIDRIDLTDAALCLDQWHLVRGGALACDLVFTQPLSDERFVLVPGVDGRALVRDDLPRHRFDRPTLFLGGSRNYYHWLIDFLPRLAALEQWRDRTDWPILINGDPLPFQMRTLEQLGIGPDRLLIPAGPCLAHFDHLTIPRLPDRPYRANGIPDWMASTATPAVAHWLRDRLAGTITADSAVPRRIMISRENSEFRRCDNEPAIRAIARRYGFEPVRLEELPFDRQVALFKGVEAVLAVHGAGCTNMLFSPPGTTLIEMHPAGNLPDFYRRLTAVLNQHHIALPGPITRSLSPAAATFWNFRMEPADVEQCLAGLPR